MRAEVRSVVAGIAVTLLLGLALDASSDEAPIAGVVKSVDNSAGTLLVESTVRGRVRQVVIHVRSESKIVRFTRSTDPGKSGFSEQAASLADLKAGWTVSVKARHEGTKEVAEIIRVVHEK
jgi:hypothetical protein